jgi:sporulation protein YunB
MFASGKVPLFLIIIIAAAVFAMGNYYISNHLRPIMTQMARVQVDQLASRVINQAIVKRISEDGVTYGSLVYFEKDIYGQITALNTDIISVNRLRADITEEVLLSLENIDTSRLAIPSGNLINSDIFSGRGPRIPLKIVPLGTVSAGFSNQFTSAGINQTRHQIMMDISVDISILLPGYSVGTQVGTQVSIAETVIVGAVPDSYFQMDDIFRAAR